jgi:hypothetical protein
VSEQLIFVETSIQVQRILANASIQGSLQQKFQSVAPHLYTTNYVWMEFQRTVVADLAHIRQLMSVHQGWSGLIRHLLTGQRAFRTRSAVRCTQLVSSLYEGSTGEWDYALMLCDELLQEELKAQFWYNVTPLRDPINCDLVTQGIMRNPDDNYVVADSCNKETATCFLPHFLTRNIDKLRVIEAYLAERPNAIKDQARVRRLLATVIENPQQALGQNSCWPLGDIIIALQAPNDAAVWTLDGDFAPIVEALGLSLYHG